MISFYNRVGKKLLGRPQLRGSVLAVRTMTPRKPNSARRPVIKVFLSIKKLQLVYIPGIGHALRKHSVVLICGGGARDLPGVKLSGVRGVLDLPGVSNRQTSRSIYGVPMDKKKKIYIRKKLRV